MKKRLTHIGIFLKELYAEWVADSCFQLAASLSYYTVFSMAPMFAVVITVASYFLGREAVTGELYMQVEGFIGPQAAASIQTMVESINQEKSSWVAKVAGGAMVLFSATAAFAALQNALNKIYKVKVDVETNAWALVLNRIFSFIMVLVIGCLLVVSLLLDVILNVLAGYLQRIFLHYSVYMLKVMHMSLSFALITLLFALIFKFLPDVKIRWRHIWKGAMLTAALFTLGKTLIGFYLAQSQVTTTYGAAASIILVMLWVNYSACILFIGAQFIDVSLKMRGEEIKASHFASKISFLRRANNRKVVNEPTDLSSPAS
ncbi:MAG: YihY/virulence factor BrkB family protein [Bacteroidota bacterium]